MNDIDAVRQHAETLTPGSPLREAMDNVIARQEENAAFRAKCAAAESVVRSQREQIAEQAAEIAKLRARVEALTAALREWETIKRVAETGTAQAFLSTDDETKRFIFALATEESERRKQAEVFIRWIVPLLKSGEISQYITNALDRARAALKLDGENL